MTLNNKALESASKALVRKYREYWPGSWPAQPEADGLSQAAITTYLTTLSADSGELVERLRAWGPLVSSGYECPAAGTAMHEAANALAAKDAMLAKKAEEMERLRDALNAVTVEASHMAMTMRRRKIFDAAARTLQEANNG